MTAILRAVCLAAMFITSFALAEESPTKARVKQFLTGSSVLELPARAAQLVTGAGPAAVDAVTVAAVETAISIKTTSAAAVVGAIARAEPLVAALAASTAVRLRPSQAAAILRAASAAAPLQASLIKVQVAKVLATVPNPPRQPAGNSTDWNHGDYVNEATAAGGHGDGHYEKP